MKKVDNSLSHNVEIEVIAIKGKTVVKQTMTYGKALFLTKKKDWKYLFYQIGFCSIKESK